MMERFRDFEIRNPIANSGEQNFILSQAEIDTVIERYILEDLDRIESVLWGLMKS